MSRKNIRTVNGARHNGQLEFQYQKIQNRAAAILDACEEFGESLSIDLISILHHISVDQIRKDLYGDSIDFKKRFGTKSKVKFQTVIKDCMKKIAGGISPALVSVANHIPFTLIRAIENSQDEDQVIAEYFRFITTQNNDQQTKENTNPILNISSNNIHSKNNISTSPPLSKIENKIISTRSNTNQYADNIVPADLHEENTVYNKKRAHPSIPVIINSSNLIEDNQSKFCAVNSSVVADIVQETPSKRLKTLYHNTMLVVSFELEMEWSITHTHGLGLSNTNKQKQCLNICYINSILQCLANIAPFVQWLLNKENHMTCTLMENNEFCSCCVLHSIIETSAISMARHITKLSSSFIPGHQEDPSEFLVVLFDHLIQCLSSTRSSDAANLSSAIHII
ncbi:unnamed protein product, partial [Rotaria magnacalcarata]